MQRSATLTGPGMALSPAAQRRTVRPSTSSCLPASTCDQPSAAIAAANSSGRTLRGPNHIKGCDSGGKIASAGQQLARGKCRLAARVGVAVHGRQPSGRALCGQRLPGVVDFVGGWLAVAAQADITAIACQDHGAGFGLAHAYLVGPLALTVNHKNEVQHEMH